MTLNVFITGATGLVGGSLSRRMRADGWSVTGSARKRPAWWPADSPFVEVDWTAGDTESLQDRMAGFPLVIHLCDIGKVDPLRNRTLAERLYRSASEAGVRRFFYGSSIRVYSGRHGSADEATPPRPAPGDGYGRHKREIEEKLVRMGRQHRLPLTLLRIGNVFSDRTPDKKPKQDSALTRWIYKGRNSHLISDANVAYAVSRLAASTLKDRRPDVVNITQEKGGENNHFFLADILAGKSASSPGRPSALGRWLRFCFSRWRGELQGEYFLTVLENRLAAYGIRYPVSLAESLRIAYACDSA